MSRRSPVAIYYSEAEKEEIEREAERAGQTVSGYCRELIDTQRGEDAKEEVADRHNAEERIEALLDDGLSEFTEEVEQLREDHALIVHILREIEGGSEGKSGDGRGRERGRGRGPTDNVDDLL